MGIITKGGRIVRSTKNLYRKMGPSGSIRRKSGGRSSASSAPTTIRSTGGGKRIQPQMRTGRNIDLSGVTLTEEQKEKLREKGYNVGKKTKAGVIPQMTQAQVDARNQAWRNRTSPQTKTATSNALGFASTSNVLRNSLQKPQLEFSVLPNSAGKTSLFTPSFNTANSTMDAARTPEERAKLASDERMENIGITAATLLTPVPGDELLAGALGARALRGGSKLARTTAPKVASKSKNVATSVVDRIKNLIMKGGRTAPSMSRGIASRAVSAFKNRPVMSSLGVALIGGAGYSGYQAYNNSVSTAGTVRNAVPSGSSTSGTSTQTDKTTTQTSPEATQTPASNVISDSGSTPVEVTSGTQKNSPISRQGGVQTGYSGMGAIEGEPQTDRYGAAQQQAMNLQRAEGSEAGAGVAPVGDQVDLAVAAQSRDKAKQLLEQYGSEATTLPEFKESINTMLASNLANLNAIQPNPPEPVIETPEQEQWLLQQDQMEQPSVREYMDQVRRDMGMTSMESQRLDVMKQLEAVSQTYQEAIDQIKQNPNLPKGLAARRMTEVFQDQKFASNQLIAQLDQLDQQLEDANNRLNFELGIYREEQSQMEKERARRLDQFGYLVDSNAVGGLDDKEIRQWSQATGIPEEAIRSLKTNALTPDRDYGVRWETDANGDTFMITYDKNNPLGEVDARFVGQFGTPKSTGGGGDTINDMSDIEAYANELINNPDFKVSNIPAEIRADAIERRNQILNAPYSDDEINQYIMGVKESGLSFEEALAEIESDPRVENRATAGHIAARIYGVKPEDFSNERGVPAIKSFFSSLFNR